MKKINSSAIDFSLLEQNGGDIKYFPLLRDEHGTEVIYCISPLHGRSFVVGRHEDGRYIVSKGNGLSYSQHTFLHTPEMPTDVWGLLLKEDALRDYYCGLDVQALGIRTNQMECVLELDLPLYIEQTGEDLKPCLLQYNVECPYRICDAPFMTRQQIVNEVAKWQRFNYSDYTQNHLIAADLLISNLRTMHDNDVLHNAIHEQNYTWALELLDFELARTPQHPYAKADYERHYGTLRDREIIQTYVIVNYIAAVLGEQADYTKIDNIFKNNGYDIASLSITCTNNSPTAGNTATTLG